MLEDTWLYIWLLLLGNSYVWEFTYAVAWSSTSLSLLHFIVYHVFLIQYSVWWTFWLFPLGPYCASCEKRFCTYLLMDIYVFIFLGLGIKLPDYKIGNCLALINIVKELSKMVQSLHTPPAMNENSAFFSTLAIDNLVNLSWCVVISCLSLRFLFAFPQWVTMLNTVSYAYCHSLSLFIKDLFKYSPPQNKIRLLFFLLIRRYIVWTRLHG